MPTEKAAPPKWGPIFDPAPWPGGNWPPIWQHPHWPPIADPIPWPGKRFPNWDPIPFPEKFWEKIRIEDIIALRMASLEAQHEVIRSQFEAEKSLLDKQRQILSKYK
jgi:hypothetical protein